jgi:Na+-translocating ferredoxin:NAD+ oxidoreductase RnfE subunit
MAAIDIFKRYDELRASGIPDEQARAQLNVMEDMLSTIMQNMVTKDDVNLKLNSFAKEYKLEVINVKLNFILWIIGPCALSIIGACIKYISIKYGL